MHVLTNFGSQSEASSQSGAYSHCHVQDFKQHGILVTIDFSMSFKEQNMLGFLLYDQYMRRTGPAIALFNELSFMDRKRQLEINIYML